MDYYIKRTVERVRQRRRSREDIEEEISIDEKLSLAAQNSIANMDIASDDSISSHGSGQGKNANRVYSEKPRRGSAQSVSWE
ncbi:hypothetical protein VB005_01417 [Metarhizium brunneum]